MDQILSVQGAASRVAGEVDSVFIYILAIGMFFFVLTQGALIYFAFRYRRRKGEKDKDTPDIRSNLALEALFVVIPSVLVISIFYYGFTVFMQMRAPIPGATGIGVVAKKWLWEFTYPDGRKTVNELRIPVGKPVELNMTSEDVIHSLYIPDYRDKQDILPGRYTQMWLLPDRTGDFQIFCAEYCGEGHSQMLARLIVMEQHEFDEWYAGKAGEELAAMPPAAHGEKLVKDSGCLSCHSLDGTVKVGPSLKGLYGRTVTLSDGSTAKADDDYIKESIVDPGAKVVKGFPNVMPTFKGSLSDKDITDVIVYMKTLK
jgi:cytochrome c oxidase subunit 2